MKTYKIAIVEDQESDLQNVRNCLDRIAEEKNIAFQVFAFSSAERFLENYCPDYDIVFMDIMLPALNGMEAAKRLRKIDTKVLLLFLTNMSDYAIKGYEVDAVGYVMKPVTYYSLAMHMGNILRKIDTSHDVSVAVRTQDGLRVLSGRDLYYIAVCDHNLIFHTAEGILTSYGTLSEREKELAGCGFARCSSWTLVNLKYVEAIYKDEIVVAGEHIRVSRNKKKAFLDAFSEFLGRR